MKFVQLVMRKPSVLTVICQSYLNIDIIGDDLRLIDCMLASLCVIASVQNFMSDLRGAHGKHAG